MLLLQLWVNLYNQAHPLCVCHKAFNKFGEYQGDGSYDKL